MPTPTLEQIGLRKAERGFITGRSGSGKSTLAEYLIPLFLRQYATSRAVILDTKPRFRAQWRLNGLKADSLYKGWDHGAYVPGSVLGDITRPDCGLGDAWKQGYRVVILQSDDENEWPLLLNGVMSFYREARTSRPQLLYVDEAMDFYGTNGQPTAGSGPNKNAIVRCVRAGREKGLGVLVSMQRPKGVPIQLIQELSRLYLFALDNEDDMDRLYDFGIPTSIYPPDRDEVFRYWRRKGPALARTLRLNIE